MRLLHGHDAAVGAFVAERIPQVRSLDAFGPSRAMGVVDERGELIAGVVFHGYIPAYHTIDVSFAADRAHWLTRRLATEIMAYPFERLKVQHLGTHTPKRNRRAREFVERFGFKREGLRRKGFGDDDMVLSGMLASEWAMSRFNLKGSRSRNGVVA